MHRLTHRYDIVSRRPVMPGGAAVADFELAWAASSPQPDLLDRALAYCADFAGERVLFSVHDQAALTRLFAAPFLFPEQWRLAAHIVSVPFEQLAEAGLPGPALQPCFVFSPGRTGSTLLVRLFEAAGLACASEPDMLQQVVWMAADDRAKLPPDADTRLAGACIAALGRVRGNGVIVKLRSQCNERPLAITRSSPGCRAVFMLRRMAPWALSRHRVFAEPPAAVASVLRQALDALDTLGLAGVPLDVLWFETLAADPMAALRICAPRTRPNASALSRVMASDSQQGSAIARSLVRHQRVQPEFMADFAAAWAVARAGAAWTTQTEALLAQMWER